MGEKVAESIHQFFEDKQNHALVKKLLKVGVRIKTPLRTASSTLAGKIFVFTGTMSMSRDEAETKVRQLGGRASSSVSKETNYVVAGDNPGSKYGTARKLGVCILTEKEFAALIK